MGILIVVLFDVIVIQRRNRSAESLGHRLDRWFQTGEEPVLIGGLANEHVQSRNDRATGSLGLPNQKRLFRVVNRIKHQRPLIEIVFAKRRGVHFREHSNRGSVDENTRLDTMSVIPGHGAATEFFCELIG